MSTIEDILRTRRQVERVLELLPADHARRGEIRRAADALAGAYADLTAAPASDELLALSRGTIERAAAALARIRSDHVVTLSASTVDLLVEVNSDIEGATVDR